MLIDNIWLDSCTVLGLLFHFASRAAVRVVVFCKYIIINNSKIIFREIRFVHWQHPPFDVHLTAVNVKDVRNIVEFKQME